eukprot:6482024-Amphidinium_carterae.1
MHERVDLLINNAGIFQDMWTPDIFTAHMETNAFGPLDLAQRVVDRFVKDLNTESPAVSGQGRQNECGYGQISNLSPFYQKAVVQAASIQEVLRLLTSMCAFIYDAPRFHSVMLTLQMQHLGDLIFDQCWQVLLPDGLAA